MQHQQSLSTAGGCAQCGYRCDDPPLLRVPPCLMAQLMADGHEAFLYFGATATGACIISKNKQRDYRKRYRKLIKNPSRVMTGLVDESRVLVPSLALNASLSDSAQEV